MIWTLLRKELRQHWLALLLLGLLTFTGYAIMLAANFASGEAGSVFDGLRLFVLFVVTLGSLTLCHRLVVVEYAAKTQLFLEALPVTRGRMVGVKYALGLVVLLAIVTAALALACVLGARNEALTPRFVGLLAVRALSAAVVIYHFFFLMSFLGRYRLALYVVAGLACAYIAELTDLQLDHFGPLALLDERFAFEREAIPWEALRQTWGLSGAMLLLTFGLALTREGTVATLLAEKMSHREKVFVAALLVGVLFAVSVLDEKAKRAPFDLHEAATAERPGVVAKVAGRSPSDETSRRLAGRVADQLAAARSYLGVTNLPPVFVVSRRDLDAHRFERGELEDASGVHVRANYLSDGFREDDFLSWLVREVVLEHSEGRAKLEPKMWVLDGFAAYFRADDPAAPLTRDRVLALRALYGTEAGFTPDDLRQWHRFRERVGEEIAAGVAWSGLKTLARRQGPDRARDFLRSVLGVTVPKGFRALLHEHSKPLEKLLKSEGGVDFETFWTQWKEDLASARRELAPVLAGLPRPRGEVTFVPLSADSRRVSYRLQLDRPPAGARYSFLHHALPVFDEEVKPQSIRREQHPLTERPEGEAKDLPESFARGSRLYWTFAIDVPELGCPVVSGWRREEVR